MVWHFNIPLWIFGIFRVDHSLTDCRGTVFFFQICSTVFLNFQQNTISPLNFLQNNLKICPFSYFNLFFLIFNHRLTNVLPYFFSINLLSPFIRGSVIIIVVLSSFLQRPLLRENVCDNPQFKSSCHHLILHDILGYNMYPCHIVFWTPWNPWLICQGFKIPYDRCL